ncbi:MAG: hypothetical protein R3342_05245 [Lutibacter sp.]|uniref:hypothetical protein n=1 Tax=Lutibacter sp. TaxID=1925666 RepID=UPI00299F451C|nr:hypothetical protein [Lutibacter sp.]MDX1828936.1 hypothetical protein [Lutibacter sp.]
MNILTKIITLFLLTFSTVVISQNKTEDCNCCSKNYKAFNFWEGNWNVYNPKGELIGSNKVRKIKLGCGLQENWIATNNKNTGTSYNYYDKADNLWHQVWISNTGNIINLEGNIDKNGVMVLKSKLVKSSKGNYYNQISWKKNKDGSVTQQWDIFNEKGEKTANAFKGIYKKKLN